MSNYSTIIESLLSTRVNEGTLLRDYKGIINQLKRAYYLRVQMSYLMMLIGYIFH